MTYVTIFDRSLDLVCAPQTLIVSRGLDKGCHEKGEGGKKKDGLHFDVAGLNLLKQLDEESSKVKPIKDINLIWKIKISEIPMPA